MTPTYKIHPAIGIARVGNSPDSFYLAPDRTGAPPIDCGPDGLPIVKDGVEQPVTKYKDAKNRIRRQAARFRVYGYDDTTPNGSELKLGDTISAVKVKSGQMFTGILQDIQWKVYLANKKSSWYTFAELSGEHGYSSTHPLRNAGITDPGLRQQLIIDPGPRTGRAPNAIPGRSPWPSTAPAPSAKSKPAGRCWTARSPSPPNRDSSR